MKIKTSELTGPALDWAVAKCEGHTPLYKDAPHANLRNKLGNIWHLDELDYSTDWSQGGPIIEKLRGESKHYFVVESDGENVHVLSWYTPHVFQRGYGPTLLIAAMRCFIASKLGDEVEIPEELL